ncbi:MAG: leucine-rich repeat protein, partial [Bacteroidales bacterium]|nr:leucine-rich repeat protein [Candidatus Colimorpha pelethequi]
MKKYLILSVLLACCFVSRAYSFSAVAPTGQTLYYSYVTPSSTTVDVTYPNSSYTVPWSGFTSPTGSVTIPSSVTYGGRTYTVTGINSYCFQGCTNLTSVTIPNTVTYIGDKAFMDCSQLSSVTIGSGVTRIYKNAFRGCYNLFSLTVPNSVTEIGNLAFYGVCNVVYSGSATGSPWGADYINSTVEGNLVFSDNTKTLLIGCNALATSVTIPNSVTSIGDYAFKDCRGLTSVTIPNSVTSIGKYAFQNCSGLTSVAFNATNCTNMGTSGDFVYPVFEGCSNITTLTIGSQVTRIPTDAFKGCGGLTSVTLPNSVTSIGDRAFYLCNGLTSVTIPNSVTSIGNAAFSNCSGLMSVTIPSSVTSIGSNAFLFVRNIVYSGNASGSQWGALTVNGYIEGDFVYENASKTKVTGCNTAATSVTIPNSVTSIGQYAFYLCSDLSNVTIGNSVTSIGQYAFQDCSELTSVIIPNSVTTIEGHAFINCSGLTNVTIGNSVTSIGEYAFMGCSGLTNVAFNAINCTSMGSSGYYNYPVFSGCTNITTLTLGSQVSIIPASAFSGLNRLTSVIIPNSVTSIGNSAFKDCSGLSSVIIGNSVFSIGGYAFSGCSGLTCVTIPNSVTTINDYAFSDCRNLASVTIGNSVTSIWNHAFSNCKGLTSVTIPNSVTTIKSYAFSGCSNLASVAISNSITSIESFVFSGCSGLIGVTIPNSVTTIKDYAFSGCNGLTSVIIGSSVTSIWDHAFSGCDGLHTIYSLNPTAPTLGGSYCFNGYFIQEIHIPCGSLESYSSRWTSYSSYLQEPTTSFERVLQSANNTMGRVSLLSPECSDSSIISAILDYGYHFTQWTDGNTENPRTFILTQDTTFTAEFDYNQYSIITASSNSTMGITTGDSTVSYQQQVTLTAIPNHGYHFVRWNDGSTDNPHTVTVIQNSTYTAQFNYNTYNITKDCDNTKGTINGLSFANYLSSVTLTATPNYGYHFTQWRDGSTTNPRTFVLTQDTTFAAEFASNQYTVTGTSASDVMGSVIGSSTVDYLQSVTLTATANYGYHFTQWSDGDTQNPRTVAADSNKSYTAQFDYNTYALTANSDNATMGTAAGSGTFNYLSTQSVSATANYGYHFTQWSDGNTDNPRSVVLTQDTTFTAEFGYKQYAVTGASDSDVMGSVAGNDTVDYLQSVTLTATA